MIEYSITYFDKDDRLNDASRIRTIMKVINSNHALRAPHERMVKHVNIIMNKYNTLLFLFRCIYLHNFVIAFDSNDVMIFVLYYHFS